ncbi:MAG TPA: transposase [Polyangia bacterium]
MPHRARPDHEQRHPVHVTLRAQPALPSLRAERSFDALRTALTASSNERFRIIHFSVQRDHVHAIVEGDDKRSLSLGVAGLKIRAAKALNRALGRSGAVWSGKYHARALRTPREMRSALLYVLQNWKKHIRGATGIDGRSSAPWFDGWKRMPAVPTAPRPVAEPRTWLAAKGWRERGGGPLGPDEMPAAGRSGPRRAGPH